MFGAKSFPAEAGPTNRVGQACGIGLSPSQESLGTCGTGFSREGANTFTSTLRRTHRATLETIPD